MLTPKMRNEDNELGFGIANRDKLEIHFITPPTKVTGGHPEEVSLPTKLLLPNGKPSEEKIRRVRKRLLDEYSEAWEELADH